MVDGTVSNAFVMHYFYNLGYGFYIFLSFSVQFHVSDMPSAGNGVERSFPFYLLGDGDGLFYIYVERVYIIVIVRHAGNDAVFAAVHTGEASGKSFGRGGKYGEIQLIFLFVFVCHFIHFRNGFE